MFDPDTQVAYCKYCYYTHDNWEPGEESGLWNCRFCDHTSKEEYMRIFQLSEVN
jgi:hypothetical protein